MVFWNLCGEFCCLHTMVHWTLFLVFLTVFFVWFVCLKAWHSPIVVYRRTIWVWWSLCIRAEQQKIKRRKSLRRNTLWFFGRKVTCWHACECTSPCTTSWGELFPTSRCQYYHSKRLKILHQRHGITSEKTWIFNKSALRTWNLTLLSLSDLETQEMAFVSIWCLTDGDERTVNK